MQFANWLSLGRLITIMCCFLPCPEATFIDASWGIAHEMPIVWNDEKVETRFLDKQKQLLGTDLHLSIGLWIKRLVDVTMANERNWVRNDQSALKMIPSMKVAGNLISSLEYAGIGFALRPEQKVREVLKFIQLRGIERVLFVFAYQGYLQRRDCERGHKGSICFRREPSLSHQGTKGLLRQCNVFFSR